MAAEKTSRDKPIHKKEAQTGDYKVSRKNEAIRAEIDANPNISARQIAETLEGKGIEVSMSHIYRQLSNYSRRNTSDRRRPWTGTNIGMPVPAGSLQEGSRTLLGSPEEYGGAQRGKETLAALDEVGKVLDTHQSGGEPDARSGQRQATSKARRAKMGRKY